MWCLQLNREEGLELFEAKQIVNRHVKHLRHLDKLRIVKLKNAVLKAAVLLLRHMQPLSHLRLRQPDRTTALFYPRPNFFFYVHINII